MTLLLAAALLLARPAAAADPAAPEKWELGKPLVTTLELPAGAELDLEKSATDYFSLKVVASKQEPSRSLWTLELIPLAVGELPIPLWFKGENAPRVLKLSVPEPDLPPNAELADIKGPARARPALWPFLLAALAAFAAWKLWHKLRKKPGPAFVPPAPPDPRTPAQIALDELAELERSDLWGTGHYKAFYGRLTDLLRAYLERRYGLPALKLTTHELSRRLRSLDVDAEAARALKALFERADLVKFAKTVPEAGQGGLDTAAARRVVEATSPSDLAAAAQERR